MTKTTDCSVAARESSPVRLRCATPNARRLPSNQLQPLLESDPDSPSSITPSFPPVDVPSFELVAGYTVVLLPASSDDPSNPRTPISSLTLLSPPSSSTFPSCPRILPCAIRSDRQVSVTYGDP